MQQLHIPPLVAVLWTAASVNGELASHAFLPASVAAAFVASAAFTASSSKRPSLHGGVVYAADKMVLELRVELVPEGASTC